MAKYPVLGSSNELFYADEMLIDNAGLDLIVDGGYALAASFENIDPFELAWQIMDPDFTFEGAPRTLVDERFKELSESIKTSSEDVIQECIVEAEERVWLALSALSALKGWDKK